MRLMETDQRQITYQALNNKLHSCKEAAVYTCCT